MAEDDDLLLLFLFRETTAKGHRNLQHIEEIRRRGLAPYPLRLALSPNGRGNKLVICGDTGKGFRLIANILVDRFRKAIATLIAIMQRVQREQRGRIANRRRPQNKTADHGKDRGIACNAESDGNDDRDGRPGRTGEPSKGVGKILLQNSHGRTPANARVYELR